MDIGNTELPVLVFSLRETLYIISVKYVRYIEILPKQIVNLPSSPHYLRGMCRFNTDDVALVSLDELLFGQQSEILDYDTDKMVIVVNNVGFIVKRILGIEPPDMFYHSEDKMTGEKMVRLYTASPEIRNEYHEFCKGNVVLEPNIPQIMKLIQSQKLDKEDGNEDNNDLP